MVVFLRSIGKEAICLTSGSRSLLLDLVGKICMILLFPEVEVTPVEPDANKIDVFYLTWAALDYCCFILNELFPTTVAFRLKMYSKAKVEVGCYYFLGRWELFIVLKSLSHMLLLWTLNCRDIFRLFDFIWFYDNFLTSIVEDLLRTLSLLLFKSTHWTPSIEEFFGLLIFRFLLKLGVCHTPSCH